jgi:1,4-alpha-glucan branching enzyme
MVDLARNHADGGHTLRRRALNQAARELMLAQSSDWTFIMKTGTTVPYATRRINQHILQFNKIYDDLRANKLQATANEAWLTDVESRNNIFPNIDYRIYAS